MTSSSHHQHLAAVLHTVGQPLKIENRPTPSPGPGELLLDVHSIALNPIDHYQRDMGFVVEHLPGVVGSDIGGVVLAAGPSVPAEAPKSGTRVSAFAITFYKRTHPDYGAFQKRVLVPWEAVSPIPDSLSFNEAAVMGMAVKTTWAGWYSIGLPRGTKYSPSDKQGVLVWGAASSVGSAALQVAKSMGLMVYATASPKHHDYIKSLGASKVFDYKDANVVDSIVKAIKEDGVTVNIGYDAAGGNQLSMQVLKQVKTEPIAKLASAAPLERVQSPQIEGVEAIFVAAPEIEEARMEFMRFSSVWLEEKLTSGEFVPSPSIKVVNGGLNSINEALDELKAGVSGTKIVLEL